MKLRELKPGDAPLMLEWMHDTDAVAHLQQNFGEKTLSDCEQFISDSMEEKDSLHLAIAGENDTYMGTVSLKHLDRQYADAEFAIAIRRCAMGKGISAFAMEQILQIGFGGLGLKRIFWCVAPENKRAVRFYEKGHYCRVNPAEVGADRYYSVEQMQKLLWYQKEA